MSEQVIVYSNTNCVQCEQTKRFLRTRNISFEERTIETSPEIMDFAKQKGYQSAPIVIAGDDSWSGFKMEKLTNLAAKAA